MLTEDQIKRILMDEQREYLADQAMGDEISLRIMEYESARILLLCYILQVPFPDWTKVRRTRKFEDLP